MWRPEDQALLGRLEDELVLERLFRHHVGTLAKEHMPHPRAAGLVAEGGGAFYLWVRIPAGETTAGYQARLLTHGVVVTGAEMFGAASEGYVRLAMVPTLDEIDGAIAAWEATL